MLVEYRPTRITTITTGMPSTVPRVLQVAITFVSIQLVLLDCTQASTFSAPQDGRIFLDDDRNLVLSAASGKAVIVDGSNLTAFVNQLQGVEAVNLTGIFNQIMALELEKSLLQSSVGRLNASLLSTGAMLSADIAMLQGNLSSTQAVMLDESKAASALMNVQASRITALSSALSTSEAHRETIVSRMATCTYNPEPILIATQEAFAFESFNIQGVAYLAVANFHTEPADSMHSHIYRWDPFLRNFTLFQSVPTKGAFFMRYFMIGNDSFLAIANYYSGSVYTVDSEVFKYTPELDQFTRFQLLATQGACSVAAFNIASDTFLFIANNRRDGNNFNADSEVFKYDSVQNKFISFQNISTSGAFSAEKFMMSSDTFLTISNWFNGVSYLLNSHVMKYDVQQGAFVLFQNISAQGATHLKPFAIASDYYLAVANCCNRSTYQLNSEIFKYNASLQQFVSFQLIPTHAAVFFEAFTIDVQFFLFVSNRYNDTWLVDSVVYRWDDKQDKFVAHQVIPTQGARVAKTFMIDHVPFLAVPFENNGTTTNLNSPVYKWCGSRFVLN